MARLGTLLLRVVNHHLKPLDFQSHVQFQMFDKEDRASLPAFTTDI